MRAWSFSTLSWTAVALVAFAANSLLCRKALGDRLLDPGAFTAVRLVSGAVALGLLVRFRGSSPRVFGGSWRSALALVAYAVPFSFAYLHLHAGTGALILFCGVQTTMIAGDMLRGRRPLRREWAGLVLALLGLAYLTRPGGNAPDPVGAALMAVAGVSWGVYSLRGRGTRDPLGVTAGNFLRGSVLVLPLLIPALFPPNLGLRGCLLAVASGAVASGLGYAVWYRALRGMGATRAAISQLLVPLLAALGGVAFLDERFTLRLFLSGTIIAGGVALAVLPFRLPGRGRPEIERNLG